MKYKVGDKIKIRNDLEIGVKYGNDKFISKMNYDKGKILTIFKINSFGYRVKESEYNWTDEMIETGFNKEIKF